MPYWSCYQVDGAGRGQETTGGNVPQKRAGSYGQPLLSQKGPEAGKDMSPLRRQRAVAAAGLDRGLPTGQAPCRLPSATNQAQLFGGQAGPTDGRPMVPRRRWSGQGSCWG